MAGLRVSAERTIAAPSETVYRCIADYRQHHPRILPPAFSEVRVEEGGVGAGTVVSFRITTAGRSRAYRMRVAEPEPGRVLTETDTASSLVTTFMVTPEGTGSRVRIETAWQGAGGFGWSDGAPLRAPGAPEAVCRRARPPRPLRPRAGDGVNGSRVSRG